MVKKKLVPDSLTSNLKECFEITLSSQNKKNVEPLKITLDNNCIPHQNKIKIKILGITFASKLNWLPHLKNIHDSISQKLNIIKIISHTPWGGDSSTLLMIYKALIQSKTDYGSKILNNTNT